MALEIPGSGSHYFVRGAGDSGARGFDREREHLRLEQKQFVFDHGEYFVRPHMELWIDWLEKKHDFAPPNLRPIRWPRPRPPLLLYAILTTICLMISPGVWYAAVAMKLVPRFAVSTSEPHKKPDYIAECVFDDEPDEKYLVLKNNAIVRISPNGNMQRVGTRVTLADSSEWTYKTQTKELRVSSDGAIHKANGSIIGHARYP